MKSEEPTARRLREQSQEGTSFRSHDLTVLAALVAGMLLLGTATSLASMREMFVMLVTKHFDTTPMEISKLGLVAFAKGAAPVGVGVIIAVAAASLAQSKGILATKAVKVNFDKLNPVNGLKNLFSMKVLKDVLRATLYCILTTVYAVWLWRSIGSQLFGLVHVGVAAGQATVMHLLMRGVVGLLAVFAPLLVPVAIFEYWLYKKQLRMDKTEVKQERKDDEGNPEIKQKRKQQAQELSAQDYADVANSSAILANPTHIAVGIYAPDLSWAPPLVSIHERGERALAVIALAKKLGIPVVRDKPLARRVYFGAKRYEFVPLDALDGVVRTLAWLADVERAGQPDQLTSSTTRQPD